jgi:uncharacterized glyoxalase superfamily protein PhnB
MENPTMTFQSLTPNLVVRDVQASVAFYRDVLGFTLAMSVPDQPPYVFAGVQQGPVQIFFNDPAAAAEELPDLLNRPIGGTLTLYILVSGIDDLFARVAPRAPVVMPMKTQFYGMREFAIADPDGWVITFAERQGRG